ncbi:MAG: hypothetical protein WHS86_03170 [Desulfosoma sp.]
MILLVQAGERNRALLRQVLEDARQSVTTAADEAQAEAIVLENAAIRTAVIDVAGLSPRVWSLCRLLASRKIPSIVILPRENQQARAAALGHGAQAVLVKPLVAREFVSLVKTLVGQS